MIFRYSDFLNLMRLVSKQDVEYVLQLQILLPLFSSFSLTCILSSTPVLSILLATLTEFPQMSYCGL